MIAEDKGEIFIQCIFSTNRKKIDDSLMLTKINEKIIKYNITNFTAYKVEEVPYSPSGKVRFNDVINLINAA